MKTFFKYFRSYIVFLVCCFNLSCSKKNSKPHKEPEPGFVEFKVNGSPVKIVYANYRYQYLLFFDHSKPAGNREAGYFLDGDEANSEIELSIFTDSIQLKNYQYDSADLAHDYQHVLSLRVRYKGERSFIHYKQDFVDINISSYKNARISGTFAARLTPETLPVGFGEPGSINITEGKINEVKVFY